MEPVFTQALALGFDFVFAAYVALPGTLTIPARASTRNITGYKKSFPFIETFLSI
jgi:hypothetical protein